MSPKNILYLTIYDNRKLLPPQMVGLSITNTKIKKDLVTGKC